MENYDPQNLCVTHYHINTLFCLPHTHDGWETLHLATNGLVCRVDEGSVVHARHSTTPDPLSLTLPPSPSVAMAAVLVTLLRWLDENERGVAGWCALVGSCDSDDINLCSLQ